MNDNVEALIYLTIAYIDFILVFQAIKFWIKHIKKKKYTCKDCTGLHCYQCIDKDSFVYNKEIKK